MSNYRRLYWRGGLYFFTMVTHQRKKIFTDKQIVDLLKKSLKKVKINHPFNIEAIVVLPDHIHCLMQLPEHEENFSTRVRLIKYYFQHYYRKTIHPNISKIWQPRYWEHLIRNEKDWQRHMDYIHYNPVKHELVKRVKDWPFSTFHYYVKQGFYLPYWGSYEPRSTAHMWLE